MPVHENLILIAYAIIPKEISIILPLMTKIFSGYIKLVLIFGLSLHLKDICYQILPMLKYF